MANPFVTLEFTPSLVRLLKDRPGRLLKVAENHRKWLLASIHPDLPDAGNAARAAAYTEAVVILKDEIRRNEAIDNFLQQPDSVHTSQVMEARVTKERLERQLEDEQRSRADLIKKLEQLSAAGSKWMEGHIEWLSGTLLPRADDEIEIRTSGKDELRSLYGSMLVLGQSPYRQTCLTVGAGRRVVSDRSIPRHQIHGYVRERHAVSIAQKHHHLVLGSCVNTPSNDEFKILVVTKKEEEFLRLAPHLRPYLEVERPVVVLDVRVGERSAYMRVYGALKEIVPGSFRSEEKRVSKGKGELPEFKTIQYWYPEDSPATVRARQR